MVGEDEVIRVEQPKDRDLNTEANFLKALKLIKKSRWNAQEA